MSLCVNCMCDKGDSETCPHCGYSEKNESGNSVYLKPGTMINDRYMIGRVLGQGGFGITYLGYDNKLNLKIAIKEYYPSSLVQRNPGDTFVVPYTGGDGDDYLHGKEKFIDEARTLAKFDDIPGIVGIKNCVESNGTAYIIMQYLDGITLKDYLKKNNNVIPYREAIDILSPVMDALVRVHSVNIIHRDISPDNIFITKSNQVKLLDFGAARLAAGEKSMSVLLKRGYAPEEQYRTKGNQGPWTDVYALCATLYRMITGTVPPDSLDRLINDSLVIPEYLPDNIKYALSKGLAVNASQRFGSVDELRQALFDVGFDDSKPIADPPMPPGPPPMPPRPNPVSSKTMIIVVSSLAACLILVLGVVAYSIHMFSQNPHDQDSGSENPSLFSRAVPTPTPTPTPDSSMNVTMDASGNIVDSSGNVIMSAEEIEAQEPHKAEPTAPPAAPPTPKPRYKVVVSHCTWSEADSAARNAGGHLVTITSQQEFDQVTSLLNGYSKVKNVWIGARVSGSFSSTSEIISAWNSALWITGEPFSFVKWRSGEPSGYDATLGSYEYYLQIFKPAADGGVWSFNDAGNDLSEYKPDTLAYVIEYEN